MDRGHRDGSRFVKGDDIDILETISVIDYWVLNWSVWGLTCKSP